MSYDKKERYFFVYVLKFFMILSYFLIFLFENYFGFNLSFFLFKIEFCLKGEYFLLEYVFFRYY